MGFKAFIYLTQRLSFSTLVFSELKSARSSAAAGLWSKSRLLSGQKLRLNVYNLSKWTLNYFSFFFFTPPPPLYSLCRGLVWVTTVRLNKSLTHLVRRKLNSIETSYIVNLLAGVTTTSPDQVQRRENVVHLLSDGMVHSYQNYPGFYRGLVFRQHWLCYHDWKQAVREHLY